MFAGLTFEIPEKVPFRLTHNIVDGMGSLGVEGVFRKTCEIILHLIRNERELLVSVLKTFIYDPLVEWKSATREEVANMKKQQIEGGEVVNIKAQTHVRNILERVRGYCTDELTGKRVVLPLSVEGQVDHLIRVCRKNEFEFTYLMNFCLFSKQQVMNYYVRCSSVGQLICNSHLSFYISKYVYYY
mgnify:FL=1